MQAVLFLALDAISSIREKSTESRFRRKYVVGNVGDKITSK